MNLSYGLLIWINEVGMGLKLDRGSVWVTVSVSMWKRWAWPIHGRHTATWSPIFSSKYWIHIAL